tara:strand:- start:744 stop:1430 length:687 start_codon:yes stop_codon:yes gene_type:complete
MNIRKIVRNLQDDEEVRGMYHQFWLAYFWHWLGALVLFLSSFFFLYLFLKWGILGTILLGLLFVIGLLWLSRTWRLWYYSMLVLTDKRLIIINQLGSFDRSVSQVELENTLDISYRKKGFLQTLFNFGSIKIQVTGLEKLEVINLPNPSLIQQDIFDLRDEHSKETVEEFSEADLLSVIKEIRSRIGENRWKIIQEGDWELKQELIDEVSDENKSQAKAIEQFFSREI